MRLYTLAAASGELDSIAALRRLGFSPSGALICRTCFVPPPAGAELSHCSACKEAHYCGAACQRADWGPCHKDECKKWKERRAALKTEIEAQKAAMQKWFERPLAELSKGADKGAGHVGRVLRRWHEGPFQVHEARGRVEGQGCVGGNATAQSILGRHYFTGEGVAQDHVEAIRLYRLAAMQGMQGAMFNLALCLAEGRGCDKAPVQAVLWMRRAAELGIAPAQHTLADWYRQGVNSLPINNKEAMRLARLGAEQGHPGATNLVSVLFAKGLGVAASLDEACKWYRQAALLGTKVSKNNLLFHARAGHAPSVAAVRELGLGPL